MSNDWFFVSTRILHIILIIIPISLFLIHNSTIIAEHKVKSSLSISPCHDHEFTLSTAYTKYKHTPSTSIHQVLAYTEYSIDRVQHTPSTAYTEYSIHRVQHTPSTAYTEYSIHWVQHTPSTASTRDCLSSRHSHAWELTPVCSFSFRRASLHDRPPSASSPWEQKGKVSLSHSNGCELTNWWIGSEHPARHPSTASKYWSKPARLRPPSPHDHRPWVHLQTR